MEGGQGRPDSCALTEGPFITLTTEQSTPGMGEVHEAFKKPAPWRIEEEKGGEREEERRIERKGGEERENGSSRKQADRNQRKRKEGKKEEGGE